MSKLEEIKRLVETAGYKKKVAESNEAAKLAELLGEQEVIAHLVYGSHKNTPGLMLTTDSRLIFVGHPIGKNTNEDLVTISAPYDKVVSVEYGIGTFGMGKLLVGVHGEQIEFSCDLKQVKSISEYIHSKSTNASPLVAGELPVNGRFPIGRLLILVGIGLILYFSFQAHNESNSKMASGSEAHEASEAELDHCFMAGQTLATTYISNMVRYSSNGLMPSTVMEEGCAKEGVTSSNAKSCVFHCENGFKKIARDATQ